MRRAAAVAGFLTLAFAVWATEPGGGRVLRVCSDPNNMPFSNERQQGFENRIAAVLASELGAKLEYVWWAQRRGFIRNTIRAGLCDVYIGIPAAMDMLLVTKPYYRSTYVFVRRKGTPAVESLDSPLLRKLRIGVQLVGDDYANTPPAHALARRGIVQNVHGYSVIGDYSQPDPPARIIDAVAKREVDVAVAWGPMAAYFASRQPTPMEVTPVRPARDGALRFVYDIAVGVRRGEHAFKAEIERALDKRRTEIRRILDEYSVPQVAP